MRVFLVVALLVIVITMIEAYVAYVAKFTTDTVDRMPLTYLDESLVDPSRVVETANGKVVGQPHPNGATQFHGIPFAKAPVGELRFAPPEPADSWSGILDGTGVGPRCMQEDGPLLGIWPGNQSEDCLWLSVSTPGADDARRPVIVWIHGGGLYAGGAGEDTYDGAHLAVRGDVVEVNVQYRLGVWGWLDVSHLGREDVARSALNGQLDQLAALRWVRDNIARFGGDPDNVTLAGHSAGACSVVALLTSADAAPLFRRAVLMSGAFTPGRPGISKREITDRFMDALGADSLAELRTATSEALLAAQGRLAEDARRLGYPDLTAFFEMTPPSPAALARAGAGGKPILQGTTAHEHHMFALLLPERSDRGQRLAASLFETMELTSEEVADLVAMLGAQRPDRTGDDLYLDALTGALTVYPQDVLTDAYGGAGADVYRYLFTATSTAFPELGAFRGLDLPYFFGTLDGAFAQRFAGDKIQDALSEEMMDAITSFARNGRPSVPDLPEWPPYTREDRSMMLFGTATELVRDPMPWMDELGSAFQAMLDIAHGQDG